MYKIMMNDIYKRSHERSWSLMKGFQCNTDKIHILKKTLMHLKNMNINQFNPKTIVYSIFLHENIKKKHTQKPKDITINIY